MRYVGTIIILISILFVSIYFKTHAKQKQSNQTFPTRIVTVEAIKSKLIPWVKKEIFIGKIKSKYSAQLAAQESGIITMINAEPGREVSKGETLVEINSKEILAKIHRNYVEIASTEMQFKRINKLYSKKLVNTSDFSKAETELKRAKANLRINQQAITKYYVKAPFDGIVQIHDIKKGDYVNAGDFLIPIINNIELYVDFSVPGEMAKKIQIGTKILIRSRTNKSEYQATVSFINKQFEPNTLNLKIRSSINKNQDISKLLLGDFVVVEVLNDMHKNVIVIPEQAVNYRSYGENVFVVQNGVVVNKFIKSIGHMDNLAIILFGIKEGEMIVTAGQNKLYDGVKVKIKQGRK